MRPTPLQVTWTCALLALAASVSAQTVYRIVGPDGKVSFSDQPPPATSKAKVSSTAAGGSASVANGPLPFELQEVAKRYPVTLYTGSGCSPCTSARNLLVQRGVPFAERTVNTESDAAALKGLSGETSLPFGTIGGQQLKGFSDLEWTQYLDAAGYPAKSVLPANYKLPAARPLTASKAAAPAEAAPPAAAEAQPTNPSRPANGFQF